MSNVRAALVGVTAGVVAFSTLWAVAPLLAGEPVMPAPRVSERAASGCVTGALAMHTLQCSRSGLLPNPMIDRGMPERVCVAERIDQTTWTACLVFDPVTGMWHTVPV